MTIARNSGGARADEAGWPWSHRKTFLGRLGAQGYAAVTIQEYRTIAGSSLQEGRIAEQEIVLCLLKT